MKIKTTVLKKLHESYSKAVLKEGGAAGHLMHVYENYDLTFAEIFEIMRLAVQGKLEKTTEKFDGVNLVFSYNVKQKQLVAARNATNIVTGGLSASELATKFSEHGENVKQAFAQGFKVLQQAVHALNKQTQVKLFGKNADTWYSIEIIYSDLGMTINYDANNIVFHSTPVFKVSNNKITKLNSTSNAELLASKINVMQAAVKLKNWRLNGPNLVRLKKLSDGSLYDIVTSRIIGQMQAVGAALDSTMTDYIKLCAFKEARELGLLDWESEMIADRLAKIPGAPNITAIKSKILSTGIKQHAAIAVDMIKAEKALKNKWVFPIEDAITDFAIEILRGLQSSLIADSHAEVMRLRQQVSDAIANIESSSNVAAITALKKQLEKLKSVETIASPMEGIVFIYKDQAYKFTGTFAAANRILGILKYGLNESVDSFDASLLKEGGHAFTDTGPIRLEVLRDVWETMKADIESLGVTNIKPIGTTFKKFVMGDVDLAVSFSGTREELYDNAVDMWGSQNVTKVGNNIVSINFPVDSSKLDDNDPRYVQVDMMIGDVNYLSWSRYGTSNIKTHKEYSPVKGAIRNVLLNTVARVISSHLVPQDPSGHVVKKFIVDSDNGLQVVVKTNLGKIDPSTGKPRVLKGWKTVERENISNDPDKVVSTLFGKKLKASDVLTVADVIKHVKTSPKLAPYKQEILQAIADDIERVAVAEPRYFEDDPNSAVEYVKSLI